jgi:hypothetical protein
MACGFLKAKNYSCSCPYRAGRLRATNYKITVPSEQNDKSRIPAGLYRIKWTWYCPDGKNIGCVETELKLE